MKYTYEQLTDLPTKEIIELFIKLQNDHQLQIEETWRNAWQYGYETGYNIGKKVANTLHEQQKGGYYVIDY